LKDEKMITYEIDGTLYINMTNRCTNTCSFCIRTESKTFEYDLWLDREPEVEEIIDEIGTADKYEEVVFCGFGEPMIRLPDLIEVARHLKKINKKVRVNTNGQADLIWGRKVARELEGLVDHISISLNASNPRSYQELCSSEFGEKAHQAIIDFAIECLKYIPQVTLSVVDVIPGEEIEKCREIAEKAGTSFRVRYMQD
jgi:TatD family-associated radical SAM protein